MIMIFIKAVAYPHTSMLQNWFSILSENLILFIWDTRNIYFEPDFRQFFSLCEQLLLFPSYLGDLIYILIQNEGRLSISFASLCIILLISLYYLFFSPLCQCWHGSVLAHSVAVHLLDILDKVHLIECWSVSMHVRREINIGQGLYALAVSSLFLHSIQRRTMYFRLHWRLGKR